MVELLLYIGIIIVITMAGVQFQSQAMEKARQVELQTVISEAEKRINDLYLGRPWETMTDAERAVYLLERGVNLTSPWKSGMQDFGLSASGRRMTGNIIVKTSDGISSNEALRMPHFSLLLNDLPRTSCIWIAVQQIGNSACVSVNSESAAAQTDCLQTPASAAAKCTKPNNMVVVRFRKE
jgi:hypothetical protein